MREALLVVLIFFGTLFCGFVVGYNSHETKYDQLLNCHKI